MINTFVKSIIMRSVKLLVNILKWLLRNILVIFLLGKHMIDDSVFSFIKRNATLSRLNTTGQKKMSNYVFLAIYLI